MPSVNPRRFAPKVKTGCHTCRIRRVKCDEQKPACKRCTSTGRKCDGYNPSPLTSRSLDRFAVKTPDDVEERRLFHLFRTTTSSQFAGHFASGFWSRIVLQACHLNSPLRHAAIALAALHEDFMQGRSRGSQNCTPSKFALRQYTNAIAGIRKSLREKDQSIMVILMSCVLFFCFENLQGQLESAIIHLRSGLNILRSSRLQIDASSTASKSVIRDDIISVLGRLGFQANYFIDRTSLVNQSQVVSQLRNLNSFRLGRISSLEEAQSRLYTCFNKTMFSEYPKDLVIDTNFNTEYHMTKCAHLILFGERSPEFIRGRDQAIYALEEWRIAFEEFLNDQERFGNGKDTKGLILLKIHHLVAMLMVTTECGCSKDETNIRSVIKDFKQILEWSRSLLSTGQLNLGPIIPNLSPDVGIIAPMFFVATKCPDYLLRAEAMEILASGPRREGIWDADTAIKIIEDLNSKSAS